MKIFIFVIPAQIEYTHFSESHVLDFYRQDASTAIIAAAINQFLQFLCLILVR